MTSESPLPSLAEPVYGPEAAEECHAAFATESRQIRKQAEKLLTAGHAGKAQVVKGLLLRVEEAGWADLHATNETPDFSIESNAVGGCLFLLAALPAAKGAGSLGKVDLENLLQLARKHTEIHMVNQEVTYGLRRVSLLPPDREICLGPNRVRNADIARWSRAIDRATKGARDAVEGLFESLSAAEAEGIRDEVLATGRYEAREGTLALPEPRPLLHQIAHHATGLRTQSFERELALIAHEDSPLSGGLTVGLFLRVLAAIQQEALMRRISLSLLSEGDVSAVSLLMDLDDMATLERLAQESASSPSEVASVVQTLVSDTTNPGQHSDFRAESRPGSMVSGKPVLGVFAALCLHPVRWIEENLDDADHGRFFESRVAEALEALGGRVTARNVRFATASGESSDLDISFLWGNRLFLIECKARALGFGRMDRMKHGLEAVEEGAFQLGLASRWIEEGPADVEGRLNLERGTLGRVDVHRFVAVASPLMDEVKVGEARALHAARIFSLGLRDAAQLAELLAEPIEAVLPEAPFFKTYGGRRFLLFP